MAQDFSAIMQIESKKEILPPFHGKEPADSMTGRAAEKGRHISAGTPEISPRRKKDAVIVSLREYQPLFTIG